MARLTVVFAGLMIFRRESNRDLWVLLLDEPGPSVPANHHFPHIPEIRGNLTVAGTSVDKADLSEVDLKIQSLPSGPLSFTNFEYVYSLTADLGRNPVREQFVADRPVSLKNRVVARFRLTNGTLEAINIDKCSWAVAPRDQPPNDFTDRLARQIIFTPSRDLRDPVVIERYRHNDHELAPFIVGPDKNGRLLVRIVNQPSCDDWKYRLKDLPFLPHFALAHKLTGNSANPPSDLVPHRHDSCEPGPRKQTELARGLDPILCPGIQDI